MSSITIPTYEGVGIALIVITTAVVAIPCFVNYQTSRHKLGIEDCVYFCRSYLSPIGHILTNAYVFKTFPSSVFAS